MAGGRPSRASIRAALWASEVRSPRASLHRPLDFRPRCSGRGHIPRPRACPRDRRPRGSATRRLPYPKALDRTPRSRRASGRHVGKIERGGAGPPHAGRGVHHDLEHGEIIIDVLGGHAIGEACADERAFQRALSADADFLALELRPIAPRRGEELLPARIVNDTRARSRPRCSTAIDTAKVGKPCRKFVVPSSGSMIHRYSLSPLRPDSSPRNA